MKKVWLCLSGVFVLLISAVLLLAIAGWQGQQAQALADEQARAGTLTSQLSGLQDDLGLRDGEIKDLQNRLAGETDEEKELARQYAEWEKWNREIREALHETN